MFIREAQEKDYEAIWEIFHSIVSLGDTYVYSPDTKKDDAIKIWCKNPEKTFVAEVDGKVLGTYYLKSNQPDLGSHICNCGYMVSNKARGLGLATAMCNHSQTEAVKRGYIGMQFNLVVSTNLGAIKLWQKLGFGFIGEIPKAYNHSKFGLVSAYVMFKHLSK